MNIVDELSTIIKSNEGEKKYCYRLTSETFMMRQAYGIEVERQDYKDGKIIKIERDIVNHISNDDKKVNDLIELLYKHLVSPIHLIDIIGEYVDEYSYDFDKSHQLEIIN